MAAIRVLGKLSKQDPRNPDKKFPRDYWGPTVGITLK